MGKASTATKNKWNAANYDRINLILPKEGKDVLKQAADRAGAKSVNSYIINAVNKQLYADGFPALVTEAEKKSHQ